MNITEPVSHSIAFVLGLVVVLLLLVSRIRKGMIRRCFVEVVVKDGKKVPVGHLKKGFSQKESVQRCGYLRVKRRYNVILPIGEKVSFFVRPGGRLRFRIRMYDVFKVICCDCPDCKSLVCISVKDHSSISVIHGYWIKWKERLKSRLDIEYESEFHLSSKTNSAIAEFGRKLRRGEFSQLDARENLPPTIGNVAQALLDELK